jgi:hypothetical protein
LTHKALVTQSGGRRVTVFAATLLVSFLSLGNGAAWAASGGHTGASLRAPKTTPVQDAAYLTNVAQADSELATYTQQDGNVALRAMLTDGSAFCALLLKDQSIDAALVDLAAGARSVESQTHLPTSVRTFNTLESVAMIDLCPSEQRMVPAAVRSKLHQLAKSLKNSPDSPQSESG